MNRFHTKFHRQNHHTYPNPYNADAGHDPIASKEQPFKGDFMLQGGLNVFAPTSSVAGYFYSNNTALCAIGGNQGLFVFSNNNANSRGIYAYSTGIAISAQASVVGINVYSLQNGIDVYGNSTGLRVYSPNEGTQSYGGIYGGRFSSPVLGLSSYGGIFGAQITSPQYGMNVFGASQYGGNFYSNNRGISAYGGQIGVDIFSPQRGINVRAVNAAVVATSQGVALSSGGGGVNVFNNKTGIFKTPSLASSIVLDVLGDAYIVGDLTIIGDLSATGIYSTFDTKVTVTSSMRVINVGTDTAVSISQTGNYPVLACYDADVSTTIPSFIVDGAKKGWVGIGTDTPLAPFHIVKNTTQSDNQPQIVITNNAATPKRIAIGIESSSYASPFIGTESNHRLLFNTASTTRMYLDNVDGDLIFSDYIDNIPTILVNGNIFNYNNIQNGKVSYTFNVDEFVTWSGTRWEYIDNLVVMDFSDDNVPYPWIANWNTTSITLNSQKGYVGLGTKSPNELLTVVGNISTVGDIFCKRINIPSGNDSLIVNGNLTVTNNLSADGIYTANNNIVAEANVIAPNTNFGDNNLLNNRLMDIRYVQLSAYYKDGDSTVSPSGPTDWKDFDLSINLNTGTYLIDSIYTIIPGSTLGIKTKWVFSGTVPGTLPEPFRFLDSYSRVDTFQPLSGMNHTAFDAINDKIGITANNGVYTYTIKGCITVATPGILKLQGSNVSAGIQALTMEANSYIQATKIK
jgi:hypothetical protein